MLKNLNKIIILPLNKLKNILSYKILKNKKFIITKIPLNSSKNASRVASIKELDTPFVRCSVTPIAARKPVLVRLFNFIFFSQGRTLYIRFYRSCS